MKNVLIILPILALIGLGCGYELTKKESPAPEPTRLAAENTDASAADEEKRELERKIADLEKRKLEEKLETLEKEVADEKKKARPAPTKKKPKPTELEMGYMRVHSPGDGWLALRGSANSGSRLIAKIPHGSVVQVDHCGPVVTSGKLRGRWCEVKYRGMGGWSFDYYLRR